MRDAGPSHGAVYASRVMKSIDDFAEDSYNRLVDPNHLYVTSRWLRVDERAGGALPTYLAVDRPGSDLIGALPCFLLDEYSIDSPFIRTDAFLATMYESMVPSYSLGGVTEGLLPSLVCGGRRTSRSEVPLRATLRAGEQGDALRFLTDKADGLAASLGAASIAFLHVPASSTNLRGILVDHGYVELPGYTAYSVPVEGGGFDGYLSRMSGRRVQSIRRERRRLQAAGVVARVEQCTDELIMEMAPLHRFHALKYGASVNLGDVVKYNQDLSDAFGDDYLIATARTHDARLRGYASFLRSGSTIHVREPGRHEAWEPSLPIYFETVFYTPIEYAVAHNYLRVDYSITADETKVSRGCEAERQYAYIKPLGPGAGRVNAALSELARRLNEASKRYSATSPEVNTGRAG